MVVLGNEPVRVNGETVGRVTSGAQGYEVGASLAFAYLPTAAADAPSAADSIEVLVFGTWIPATITAEPAYDPSMARIRA
jgi:4-methylaminobutanoate oxidase (formaldehyde-forming)